MHKEHFVIACPTAWWWVILLHAAHNRFKKSDSLPHIHEPDCGVNTLKVEVTLVEHFCEHMGVTSAVHCHINPVCWSACKHTILSRLISKFPSSCYWTDEYMGPSQMWMSPVLAGHDQPVTLCRYHIKSWLFVTPILEDYADLCPCVLSNVSFIHLNQSSHIALPTESTGCAFGSKSKLPMSCYHAQLNTSWEKFWLLNW